MTEDTIFLLTDDGDELQPVPNVAYKTEDVLQRLIAKYPDLIVGEQIDADALPRWLMVAREARIPDSENGGSRWSVDHLLLDQYGRPTFVEAKRSSNTQIRREIVGQILAEARANFDGKIRIVGDILKAIELSDFAVEEIAQEKTLREPGSAKILQSPHGFGLLHIRFFQEYRCVILTRSSALICETTLHSR
jgi:hypothetical protein